MNVVFSKISYVEIKKQREEVLKKVDTFDALKEESIHYLFKRFPFFGIYLAYFYFIIDKCSQTVYITVLNYFKSLITNTSVTRLYVISLLVSFIIIAIALIFAYKMIFFIARKILPRKTPTADKEYKYKCFLRESENIKKALAVMEEINKLNTEDIRYSEIIIEKDSDEITLFLKDSKCGITTKQKYFVSHAAMMKKLRESGELDFTYLDEEWETLVQKYQLE